MACTKSVSSKSSSRSRFPQILRKHRILLTSYPLPVRFWSWVIGANKYNFVLANKLALALYNVRKIAQVLHPSSLELGAQIVLWAWIARSMASTNKSSKKPRTALCSWEYFIIIEDGNRSQYEEVIALCKCKLTEAMREISKKGGSEAKSAKKKWELVARVGVILVKRKISWKTSGIVLWEKLILY